MAETATATKMILDFTNVKDQSGVNPKHMPAGDYRVKVAKVTAGDSKKGTPQWMFLMVPTNMQSASYPYYCQLTPEALWKIRNLLIAAGIDVPKKKVNVDPNKIVGREIGVTLDDDEYEGKMKSVITAVFPASDLDDADLPADSSSDDDDEAGETEEVADVSDDDMEELEVDDL